jgi:hypothetical protein
MVWDRRKQILRASLWALAVAALAGVFVFVLVVAPSLIIGSPPRGLSAADELKARNDVRATLVQALAGLAVAGGLVVTYRTYRQNRAEQDRAYKQHQDEQKDTRQEQDRTYERELYAKAVEQLGHEKAPVRLGALYSLERLAEDKPERRQIIVDVICAYLRMPFSPTAPAIKTEPEATEAPDVPAAETERKTERTGNTWQQEKQVRLTAQHILTKHLANHRPRNAPTDPPNPRFWPDTRLNLDGATLINFDLRDCRVAETTFNGATFAGVADFGEATFAGPASFRDAKFTGDASFCDANFTDDGRVVEMTWFNEATFTGRANFFMAKFAGGATFSGATFTDKANFGGVEGGVYLQDSIVTRSNSGHVWPAGWFPGKDGSSGRTVVRTDDGPDYRPELPGLKPEEPPAAGRAGGS